MMQFPEDDQSKAALPTWERQYLPALQEAERAVASGRFGDACTLITSAAADITELGRPQVALDMVAWFHTQVPDADLSTGERAGLLNIEGNARGRLGQSDKAIAAYEQMRELGEEAGDESTVSTADQNLGVQAFMRGDHEAARRFYARSATVKLALRDYYAVVQLLFNLAVIAEETGDVAQAEDTLNSINRIMDRSISSDAATMHRFRYDLAFQRGRVATLRRDFTLAVQLYKDALRHARLWRNPYAQSRALQNLGTATLDDGRAGEALRWYRRALRLAEPLGILPVQRELETAIGLALHRSGRNAEALAHFDRARRLADEQGDRRTWATTTADMGALAFQSRNVSSANDLMEQALPALQNLGDVEWTVRVLKNLVLVKRALGDWTAMTERAAEAMLVMPPDRPEERASLLRQVATALLMDRVRVGQAAELFEQAMGEEQRSEDVRAAAWHAVNSAALLRQSGGALEALPFFERAVALYGQTGDEQGLFNALNDRAIALTDVGRYLEARRDYEACLALAAQRDDRAMELQTAQNLGETLRRAGDLDGALRWLERSLDLARNLGDEAVEMQCLDLYGLALTESDRWEESEDAFQRALAMARRLRQGLVEASARRGLGNVDHYFGRYASAVRQYGRAARIWARMGDYSHQAEALAHLVLTLTVSGRLSEVTEQLQPLADAAKKGHAVRVAARGVAAVAAELLKRGALVVAAEFFATSFVMHQAARDAQEYLAEEAMTDAVAYLLDQTQKQTAIKPDEFLAQVAQALDSRAPRARGWLQRAMTRMREADASEENNSN